MGRTITSFEIDNILPQFKLCYSKRKVHPLDAKLFSNHNCKINKEFVPKCLPIFEHYFFPPKSIAYIHWLHKNTFQKDTTDWIEQEIQLVKEENSKSSTRNGQEERSLPAVVEGTSSVVVACTIIIGCYRATVGRKREGKRSSIKSNGDCH